VCHRPWQKELVGIIPLSFTVVLCSDWPVSMPVSVHGSLLRICSTVRRRIPRPPDQLRSRSGRRHHDSWSWHHRVQQNLSFVIIPLNSSFARSKGWISGSGPFGIASHSACERISSCVCWPMMSNGTCAEPWRRCCLTMQSCPTAVVLVMPLLRQGRLPPHRRKRPRG
jgi:hypothetical protein